MIDFIYELDLPFPPTVNHAWGQAGKRRFLRKPGIEFRQEVWVATRKCGKLDGRLEVMIWVHAPNKRKYDIDNRIKATLDALQHAGVFDDDECIDALHVYRGDIIKGGACRVIIRKME